MGDSDSLEVAILTGTGRSFCVGEDMKEAVDRGEPGFSKQKTENPFYDRSLQKPVIAAINGYAMGGGFMLVEGTDLRVSVKDAIFEMSEAKRWLLGGYNHGFIAGLPHPIVTEMALGFRFTAERLYEVGFLNRLVDADNLMPTVMEMAEHLLTLPPAARVNTVYMMRQMIPQVHLGLNDSGQHCTSTAAKKIAWSRGGRLQKSVSLSLKDGMIPKTVTVCRPLSPSRRLNEYSPRK